MHAIINDVHPVDLVLSIEEVIESSVNILSDWPPRVVIVDEVTKAGRINDRET